MQRVSQCVGALILLFGVSACGTQVVPPPVAAPVSPPVSAPAPAPAATPAATTAQEIMTGCEGEGCDCFQEYRVATDEARSKPAATIRPFNLYQERSLQSQRLGEFAAGVKARPIAQQMVVAERGEYVVEAIQNQTILLKAGDRLDTMIDEGEGFSRARRGGTWVSFSYDDLTLRTERETVLNHWLNLEIDGLKGYTQQQPFQGCLE